MRKTILLLILAYITGIATATTAGPGETTVLDDNITANGSSPEIVSSQLPRNLNLTVNGSNLTATPSYDLYPGNHTGKVELSNGYTQTYTVEVPETFNWTLSPELLNGTISVGSSGQINNTHIQLESNIDPQFSGEITGNISEFFSVDRFQFEEAGNYTAVLGYGINENTQFGNYSGQLVVEGNKGENQTINLSYVFEDNISPTTSDIDVSNLMSTKTGEFSVVANDNLNVSSVCAEISREVEVEQENKTILENQSFDSSPYCFEQESNTALWKLDFTETEYISQYYANITINDTSGNTIHSFQPFKVEGLNALEVLNTDFRYEAIWPTSQAEEKIIDLSTSSPVTLELENFQYEGNNTVRPGILKEGDQNPIYFDNNDGEITVEDVGSYKLVVDSSEDSDVDSQREFSGVLNLSTVPQHVEHESEIRFSGLVNPNDSPEPAEEQIAGFRGFIGYSIPEEYYENYSTNSTGEIVFIGTVDRSECTGYTRWNDCTGATFGQIDEVKAENDRLESRSFWSLLIGGAVGFAGILFAGLITRRYAAWAIVAVKPVKIEHHDKTFTEEELQELGVLE